MSAIKIASHPALSLDAKLILTRDALSNPHDPTALPSVEHTQKALDRALDEYRSSRTRDGIGVGILTTNRWLVAGSIGAGALMVPPVGAVATLTVAGTAFVLDQLMETTVDLFAEHSAAHSRRQLAAHLHTLRDQENLDLERLNGLELVEARERVFGERTGFLARIEQMDLSPDEREIVEAHLRRTFEDAVTQQLGLSQIADEARDVRIDDLQVSVTDLLATQRSLLDFQEAANQRFAAMKDSLAAVTDGLTTLQNDVNQLRGDIATQGRSVAFLEGYLFTRMPPAEQRSALEQGMFPGMPETERQRRIKQLTLLENRQNLIDATRRALHGAQILTTVADRLGVDPKLIDRAQKLVSLGNIALDVSVALSSGQWMTALGSLTGLLGGPDIGTVRHRQIMGALSALQQGQTQIMRNQAEILARQQMILENQQKLFEALGTISAQIRDSHTAVMDELHRQRAEIRVNRSILIEILRRNLDAGERFLELRARSPHFDFRDGQFHGYAGLARHYRSYPHLFKQAANDVETLARPGQLSTFFWLASYPEALMETSVADVQRAHQLLISAFERVAIRKQIAAEELGASLLLPSRTFLHARKKLEAATNIGAPERTRLRHVLTVLRERVAVEPIHQVARWTLETHFYYQFFKEPFGALHESAAIVAQPDLSPHGRILLEDIHVLVDGAIAQNALQSGDLIITDVVETLLKLLDDGRTDEIEEDVLELLDRNILLQRNVLRCLVQQLLGQADVFVLDVARQEPDLGWLQQLVAGPWELERKHDEWLMVFRSSRAPGGSYRFVLPSARELLQREINHGADLLPLLDLRERLTAAMFNYDSSRDRNLAPLILAAASRKG